MRKKKKAKGTIATARTPHSAIHHRRPRPVRRSRPITTAEPLDHVPSLYSLARAIVAWRPETVALHTSAALCAFALVTAAIGMIVQGNRSFVSYYSAEIRAVGLFPYAFPTLLLMGVAVARSRYASSPAYDESKPWNRLAATAIACGMLMAFCPLLFSMAESVSQWIHGHFALSNAFVRVFQFLLLTLTCALPTCCLGMLMFQLYRVMGRESQALSTILAMWCAGAILGVVLATVVKAAPSLALQAASLPNFAIALIAGKMMIPEAPKSMTTSA